MSTFGQSNLFPQQLTKLGFVSFHVNEAHIIVPPVCEVEAGYFLMGSDPQQDKEAFEAEKPQHWVNLAAYQIAKFPVTVAEYAGFVRDGGKEPTTKDFLTWARQLQHPDHPVVCVQWRDAVAYAAWLAKLTGQRWRLPTEAEWEKAARWDSKGKGYSRIYPWGDHFDKNLCNTNASNIRTTSEIGRYPRGASPCGAQDMAGNVWEWTSSAFNPYPYDAQDVREDPSTNRNRVLRGGAWLLEPRVARAACRNNEHPSQFAGFFYDVGFRLLLEVSA
jgi:formylglycine-generating enzyme required for sulfatase activity